MIAVKHVLLRFVASGGDMKKDVIGKLLIRNEVGETLAWTHGVARDGDMIKYLTRRRVLVDFDNDVSAMEVDARSFLCRLNRPWSEEETSVRLSSMLEQLGHQKIWQTAQIKEEDIPGKSQAVKRKLRRELEEILGLKGLCLGMDLDPIKHLLATD